MDIESRLIESFHCAKCRGTAATVRETRLPANSLRQFINDKGIYSKYYVVSCGLCGYSELYDSRVLALQKEPGPEKAPVPQQP